MKRMKASLVIASVMVVMGAFSLVKHITAQPIPTIGYIPGYGYVISYVARLLGPQVYIGPQGTALTQGIQVYSSSITPAATAASVGVSVQTFTVNGLVAGSPVFVTGPAPNTQCPLTGAYVSANNTLALEFTNLAASACTPASGTYSVVSVK